MRRVLKWSAGIAALSVAAVMGAGSISPQYEHYGWFRDGLNEMDGVSIGDTREELIYSLGKPTWTHPLANSQDITFTDSVNDPSAAEKVNTDGALIWYVNGYMLTAEIDPDTKKVSRIQCSSGAVREASTQCRTISGITSNGERYNGTEDYIVDRLGAPDRADYDNVQGLNRKIIIYNKLGLTFVLAGDQILSITQAGTNQSFFWWMLHGPKLAI